MNQEKDNKPILRKISKNNLILNACSGKRTIANSKNIFSSIDSDFITWGTNIPSSQTNETIVDVYEMVKHATFAQMFASLNSNLDKQCLTQDQILIFIQKYPEMLREGGIATFFLFKSGCNFFIARVRFDPRTENPKNFMRVRIRRFDDDDMWGPARKRRVVVPRQDL